MRRARPRSVRVALYGDRARDHGRERPRHADRARAANGGRGLRGIAERVGAVGGTLEHGPDGSGGYRLRAVFPRVRPMIRLLVADDDALVRGGLRTLLQTEPDIEVVGEAADGVEAVRRARELDPDVVLMDVRMPRMDGIEATRAIVAHSPERRGCSS